MSNFAEKVVGLAVGQELIDRCWGRVAKEGESGRLRFLETYGCQSNMT